MSINLSSNFLLSAALPLDGRTVQANAAARLAIPNVERFDGLLVYEVDTMDTWQLQGGITNSNWVMVYGAGGGTEGIDTVLSIEQQFTTNRFMDVNGFSYTIIDSPNYTDGFFSLGGGIAYIGDFMGDQNNTYIEVNDESGQQYILFEAANGVLVNTNLIMNTFDSIQFNGNAGGVFSISANTGGATFGWVLPSTQGGAGQVLSNDGSGNLSWVANGGGGGTEGIDTVLSIGQVFTADRVMNIETFTYTIISNAYGDGLFEVNDSNGVVSLGDIGGDINGNTFIINDGSSTTMSYIASGLFNIASNTYTNGLFNIQDSDGTIYIGDYFEDVEGTYISLVDSTQKVFVNTLTFVAGNTSSYPDGLLGITATGGGLGTAFLGDNGGGGNSTTINVDDGAQTITGISGTGMVIQGDNGTSAYLGLQAEAGFRVNPFELRFYEPVASPVNYVGFSAPSTLSTSTIWTLPATDGTSGQALVTNGSRVLSWGGAGAEGIDSVLAVMQSFTADRFMNIVTYDYTVFSTNYPDGMFTLNDGGSFGQGYFAIGDFESDGNANFLVISDGFGIINMGLGIGASFYITTHNYQNPSSWLFEVRDGGLGGFGQVYVGDATGAGNGTHITVDDNAQMIIMSANDNIQFNSNIDVTQGLIDSTNSLGSSGQVLSSTGTQVEWVDAAITDGSAAAGQVAYWTSPTQLEGSAKFLWNDSVGRLTLDYVGGPSFEIGYISGLTHFTTVFTVDPTTGNLTISPANLQIELASNVQISYALGIGVTASTSEEYLHIAANGANTAQIRLGIGSSGQPLTNLQDGDIWYGSNVVSGPSHLWMYQGTQTLQLDRQVTSGSFSGTGTATTSFTVTFGFTAPNNTYKVNITPTSLLGTTSYYISAKTTTTFTVTYVTGLTGALTFDWAMYP